MADTDFFVDVIDKGAGRAPQFYLQRGLLRARPSARSTRRSPTASPPGARTPGEDLHGPPYRRLPTRSSSLPSQATEFNIEVFPVAPLPAGRATPADFVRVHAPAGQRPALDLQLTRPSRPPGVVQILQQAGEAQLDPPAVFLPERPRAISHVKAEPACGERQRRGPASRRQRMARTGPALP